MRRWNLDPLHSISNLKFYLTWQDPAIIFNINVRFADIISVSVNQLISRRIKNVCYYLKQYRVFLGVLYGVFVIFLPCVAYNWIADHNEVALDISYGTNKLFSFTLALEIRRYRLDVVTAIVRSINNLALFTFS